MNYKRIAVIYLCTMSIVITAYSADQSGLLPKEGMHESIKEKIDSASKIYGRGRVVQYREDEAIFDMRFIDDAARFNDSIAHIVLSAGKLMTNQARLGYLWSDVNYEDRKTIVKEMIEVEKIDPNSIQYGFDSRTPLLESFKFQDSDFTLYLKQHGAKPDTKVRKFFRKHPEVSDLFYKSILVNTVPIQKEEKQVTRSAAFNTIVANAGIDTDDIWLHDIMSELDI